MNEGVRSTVVNKRVAVERSRIRVTPHISALLLAYLLIGACGPSEKTGLDANRGEPSSTVTVAGADNVTGAVAPTGPTWGAPNDGEWTMAARDYANTRYSPLNEITTENVSELALAWTFDNGVPQGQEGRRW